MAYTDNSQQPQEASGDAGQVRMYSISEQIKSNQYAAAVAASGLLRKGLRFTKLVPPLQCPAVTNLPDLIPGDSSFQ